MAHYPIRAAAKLTGLSIDTLRAWERRYKAVVPERSDRGRQYSREQIQRLSLLRDLVERGHAIGTIAGLADDDLRALLTAHPSPVGPVGPRADVIEPLLEAFLDLRYNEANEELGRLAALLSPRDLVYQVVLPLMRDAGARTHDTATGVAQEHLVSAALRNVLGSVLRLYPTKPGAPRMVFATMPNELHEFGILASAMVAAIAGMDVLYFGPNLPPSQFAWAADKTNAAYAVVGNSGGATQAAFLTDLASALPRQTELWIGGPVVPELPSHDSGQVIRTFPNIEGFEEQCRSALSTR